MRSLHRVSSLLVFFAALLLLAATALGADPGDTYPPGNPISDQKPGSILIYNVYTSSPSGAASHNTKINITNTSSSTPTLVHLFFIDGATCSPADSMICLTQNQTVSFRASDLDPGVTGFLMAVAIDQNGWPVNHNFLVGDLYVKFVTGHAASLPAESIGARILPPYNAMAFMATLRFDDVQYDRLPQVLSVSNFPSQADGNSTMVILNRLSGSLLTGVDKIGSLFGVLYNDRENAYSYHLSAIQCQARFTISDYWIRTAPRVSGVISAGRTGWTKLYSISGAPLLGAVINANLDTAFVPTAFASGRNLHILTRTNSQILIPVFPGSC
jgi:hypothetical protein